MSKTTDQRLKIFERYSNNLHFLKVNGYLNKIELEYEHTYICPLCCEQFDITDLDTRKKNHLTLEDVPPKSLGGKANILTCKECNNVAGYKIDSHLQAGLKALDARQFLPGSESKVKFFKDDKVVQGSIKVEKDRTIKAYNSYKNNNPVKLDEYIGGISPEDGKNKLSFEFVSPNSNDRRLQIGLLKTAYLQLFEKFGYSLILEPIYDPVREQIKNPDLEIYPIRFWFTGPFTKNQLGVHILSNPGVECFMSIFPLQTIEERIFAAILPLKENPILEVVAGFHAHLALELSEGVMNRLENPNGYLIHPDAIEEFVKRIESIRSKE